MATYESSSSRNVTGGGVTAPARELRAVAVFCRWLTARKHMRALHRLDDRMLDDIGVTRSDLEWAELQSVHADPTEALAVRRREAEWVARKTARQMMCR